MKTGFPMGFFPGHASHGGVERPADWADAGQMGDGTPMFLLKKE